jgi:phosphoribosylformimino-5-aminoimidazole carboxamide ribotide isomerase
MIIYPAMDLMDGKVVRLSQGRFEDPTAYSDSPSAALRAFEEEGASWVHVVDLDGARAKEPRQHQLIAALGQSSELKVQAGGGFRTRDEVARALEGGIARVVIGSLAVSDPGLVNGWIEKFGADRICLSLDVRIVSGQPMVACHGWQAMSGKSLWDVAACFPTARHVLITDIGRDGMLGGPNFELYRKVAAGLPDLQVQASGGVSTLGDLKALDTAGVIVGKALWDGRIKLAEALRCARA